MLIHHKPAQQYSSGVPPPPKQTRHNLLFLPLQGTEAELALQTVCHHHSLLFIKFMIIEGATLVHLTQLDLLKAQRDMLILLDMCAAYPSLLGQPLHASICMLIGQPHFFCSPLALLFLAAVMPKRAVAPAVCMPASHARRSVILCLLRLCIPAVCLLSAAAVIPGNTVCSTAVGCCACFTASCCG